jgi:5-methylcytosine-specific restriction endonuclease McrA
MNVQVIVLNQDMTILGTTTWKRAIRLVAKGKAEVLAESDNRIHPSMFIPTVIRLVKAIRNLWRTQVPWSKANVHTRDMWTCQYCGEKILRRSGLTVDHVIPQAQGGKNTWDNTVTACFPCNNRKGDKTPHEARMGLIKGLPGHPTIMEFILRKIRQEGLESMLQELGIY